MELLIIEKQAFNELFYKLDCLQTKVNSLYKNSGVAPEEWVDNQQACFRLNVCKRTMQHLRDSGVLSYTKKGAKIQYKPEDIEKMLLRGYKSINN